MTFVAPEACPDAWTPPHVGAPAEGTADGTASVLVGGDFAALGAAAGAEGVVVARGHATFALEAPGTYQVGVTAIGSQVAPHTDSDMLTVGGDLAVLPGTVLDVGQGRGGDAVVGGAVSRGGATQVAGELDRPYPTAATAYDGLLGGLAAKSAGYAALAPTGLVGVTDTAIALVGDGVSDVQVFAVDGATLGALQGVGRSLQVLGVPAGATVVVNLTGPAVDLDVDSLLGLDGTILDPIADPAFAELATHLLWNVPTATTVDIGGQGQLPGSLLVPTAPSTTTIAAAGTNGRVLVAGDLVHTGSGTLHSYPFAGDPDLRCGPELQHLGTLTLDVELADPDRVVAEDRFFEGRFTCTLDGKDVTPHDDTWQLRASADARVLSDQIPVGASCTIIERLDSPPSKGYEWAAPLMEPEKVRVAKRDPRGTTLTNRARAVPEPPEPPATEDPAPTTPPESEPPASEPADPEDAPTGPPATGGPEPTGEPEPSEPTSLPEPEPEPTATPTADAAVPHADAPRPSGEASPLTTAPFTLRGTFVWGPLVALSLLTLLIRIRRRPRHQRLH